MTQEYTRISTRTIPVDRIADLIITAFEGGINYWCGSADLVKGETTERPWYSDPKLYEQYFEIKLTDAEGDDGPWLLNPDALRRGIDATNDDLSSRIFAEDGDYDAEDADQFIQLCLFGEVVYG